VLPELLYSHVIEIDERMGATARRCGARPDRRAGLPGMRWRPAFAGHRLHARLPLPRTKAGGNTGARDRLYAGLVSHEVSPMMKLVARGDTTVVDHLSPILRRYVDQVAQELPGVNLQFMQSNGGLTDARAFQGKDSPERPGRRHRRHGRASQLAGFDKVIGFDMGGTSTDVSHYSGEFERVFETRWPACACARP
jgi:5-oxoprolinase (ATP-hydrolysing)